MKCSYCKNDVQINYMQSLEPDMAIESKATFRYRCNFCDVEEFETIEFNSKSFRNLLELDYRSPNDITKAIKMMNNSYKEIDFTQLRYKQAFDKELERMRQITCAPLINEREYIEKLKKLNDMYFK